jgi:hypothetical protein
MLHASDGRFDEAWQDLLACHRLGRLIARGAEYNEFVLGRYISQVAGDAELALLERAQPTAQQAQAWLRDSLATVIDALRGGKEYCEEVSKKLGVVMIDSFMPAIRWMKRVADRTEQVERNLHLAFALAAYRSEHGRYPEQLDALAPRYLAAVPTDLFSGKALVYRPLKDGYLLYSVGVNSLDEQGHGADDTPRGDDLSIRMPLPALPRK